VEEMKKTGRIKDLTVRDQDSYIYDYQHRWMVIPTNWVRYRIADARLLNGGRQALASVCCWEADGSFSPMRFWVTRAGREWKFYDWEFVDFGSRLSFQAVLYNSYGADDPRLVDHFAAESDIIAADRLFSQRKYEDAYAAVMRAEKRSRIPELDDQHLVRLAFAWHRLGKSRDCLRCARQVKSPIASPGGLYVQSLVYQDHGLCRRALNLAEQYIAAVGGSPEAWAIAARSRARLGERKTAADAWKHALRFDPDNADALTSLASVVDATDCQMLLDCLQKTTRPIEGAATLIEEIATSADPEVVKAVLDLVVATEPDSAQAAFEQGQVAWATGNREEAARFFKLAFQKEVDADRKQRYVARFLNAMAAAGKLVEAYAEAPDSEAAFQHFVGWDDDDGIDLAPEKLRALLEAHRLEHPHDPWLHYQEGRLLQRERKFPDAEREFAAALEHAVDDDQRSQFQIALIDLLHQAGRDRRAYENLTPAADVFKRLVQLHQWKSQAGNLSEIYTLHAATHPDDPWLPFCAALIEQAGGNKPEALRLILQASQAAGGEALAQQFRWKTIALVVDSSEFSAAYPLFPDPDAALAALAQRLSWKPDPEKLAALLDQHSQSHPRSTVWQYWNAFRCWNSQDYAGIAAAGAAGHAFVAGWQSRESAQFQKWYVHSLVKLGRIDEALKFATELSDDWCQTEPLEFVQLHRRNLPELKRLLAERAARPPEIDEFYRDPDTAPLLDEPEFLEFRKEFPRQLPYLWERSSAVLLFREINSISAETLQQAAIAALGDESRVDDLAPVTGPVHEERLGQWMVRHGDLRIIVTAGRGRYRLNFAPDDAAFHSEDLARAAADHGGWIRLELLDSYHSLGTSPSQPAGYYRLIAGLLDENALALYWSETGRLIESSAELRGQLAADDRSELLNDKGEEVSLESAQEMGAGADTNDKSVSFADLAGLVAEFAVPRSASRVRVRVAFTAGSASEILEFDVLKIARAEFQGFILTGALRAGSKFHTRLVPGESFSFYSNRVQSIERIE